MADPRVNTRRRYPEKWLAVHAAAGRAAFRAGAPRSHNPHPVGSTAYSAWRRAWLAEQTAATRPSVLFDPALSADA